MQSCCEINSFFATTFARVFHPSLIDRFEQNALIWCEACTINKQNFLLFTDLDGSLLDHDDYSFDPALPALARLREARVPVIPATSKTAVEVIALNRSLENPAPFIFENGTGLALPQGLFTGHGSDIVLGEYCLRLLGRSYDSIVRILDELRSREGYRFDGFADWSTKAVATRTGLSMRDALAAKQRRGSEPILWHDSEEALAAFSSRLAEQNLQPVRGGRFISIQGEATKASAMRELSGYYADKWQQTPQIIAVGDSANDLDMLRDAHHAIVIRSATGTHLGLDNHRSVFFTDHAGPYGWREGIDWIFDEVLT